MKLILAVVALSALGLASAACPNLCSQHGQCGENDRCTCFSNWQGADCSERVCAYGLAWVDAPTGTDTAHWYAECSNKGLCNRETGECECFEGFEGKGCKRMSCPNDCSGHGTCYFLEDVASLNNKLVVNYGTEATGRRDRAWYDLWDKSKIQACVCDPYYEGADCSLRQCPRGDNKLTTGSRTSAGVTEAKDQGYTVQEILIAQTTTTAGFAGEFTLTHTDLFGGVWETDPIQMTPDPTTAGATGTAGTIWGGVAASGSAAYIKDRIQAELRNLPNQVMENVVVTSIPCGVSGVVPALAATACSGGAPSDTTNEVCVGLASGSTAADVYEAAHSKNLGSYIGHVLTLPDALFATKFDSAAATPDNGGAAWSNAHADGGNWAGRGECYNFKVEFQGDQNSGVQNLLKVNYKGCNHAGCAPQYTGIIDGDVDNTAAKRLYVAVADVTTYVKASGNTRLHKEAAVCSEHGLCDTTTGLCQCFTGFYDEDCAQQTVLV